MSKVAEKKAEMKSRRESDSRYKVGPSGLTRYSRWLSRRTPRKSVQEVSE